jgi:hypothetical protein
MAECRLGLRHHPFFHLNRQKAPLEHHPGAPPGHPNPDRCLPASLRTATAKKLEPTSIPSVLHDNCAFISGCRSDQESSDAVFGGRPNGALTYYLLNALNTPDGLTQGLTTLITRVRQQLKVHGYNQEPQLHGPKSLVDRPFLGSPATAINSKTQPSAARRRHQRAR